jgi:hypothetical protein
VIKALGGYFYELSLGKRQPDELYRLSDDPSCVHNLANDLAFKDKMMELQYQMMSLLKEDEDPRALGHFEVFDLYKYQGGRGKGYDSWLKKQEETTLTDLEKKIEEEAKQPPKKRKKAAD